MSREFETWRPTVAVVDQYDPMGPGDPILLWVDQPTSAASLASHLRVRQAARALPARVGVEWSPTHAPARAQGLKLTRKLPRTLAAGEQTIIEIELSTRKPQRFIAVEVPLPAGLESVDTSLGLGAAARVAAGGGKGVVRSAFLSHHELRPDRVLLFFDSLPPGSTTHSIAVVATTPGRFTVPAAVAEAMYEPETHARTARALLKVSP